MSAQRRLRVCLVYDCLFPHTIGGAERWYRNLAERLVADGHEVTYLTLRQWDRGTDPGMQGVDVRAVGPRMRLYAGPGRRRILPPGVFGLGVFFHLLRHGRRYDVVHTASFPYFSLLAAGLLRPLGRYRLVVDWHEVWSRDYWQEYLGPVGGAIGWTVQRVCVRLPQRAFCFSQLHRDRLASAGLRGSARTLPGEYEGPLRAQRSDAVEPLVVYAGRHIPEKRVPAIIPAVVEARRRIPELRALILGNGPDRSEVLRLVFAHGLGGAVEAPGFVPSAAVVDALGRALCLVLPSRREGYGMVVIEAASRGTPVIVVAGPDNAATELVVDGVNGFIAASASAEDLAAAIIRVRDGGQALRDSTAAWFERNAQRMSIEGSLAVALEAYGRRTADARS